MIQLSKHIEILLLDNDCVIVPNLGGFMAYHVDARFDDRDNSFLPPMRTLGFNQHLRLNDSLLVQSYVEAYDLSYPEALRRIDAEVEELKQHLNNDGFYELNDIGVLSLNEDGKLLFEPCEAGILTPELYGLSSFEFSPLANAVKAVEEPTCLTIDMHTDNNMPKTSEATEEVVLEDDDNDNVIKIKVAWIRNVAAVAAAIIAFFLFSTPIENDHYTNTTLSNVGGLMLTDVMTTESYEKKEVTIKSEDISKAIAAQNDSANQVKLDTVKADSATHKNVTAKPNRPYSIVMASRITKKNAEKFVAELHKNGYDKAHVFINDGIVRVAYGEYATQSEAYNELAKIKTNEKYAQSWVYRKK